MAKEYIEREAALKAIHDEWDDVCNYDGSGRELANEMGSVIDGVPAADVRPVVRGRWVKCKMSAWGYRQWYECSECGEPCFPSYGHPARTNFCHNCGAKMEVQDG